MKARRVRLGGGQLRHVPVPENRQEAEGLVYCGKTGKYLDVPDDTAMDCPLCVKAMGQREPGLR